MPDPPLAEATAAVTLGTDLYIIDKMSEIIAYQHAIIGMGKDGCMKSKQGLRVTTSSVR